MPGGEPRCSGSCPRADEGASEQGEHVTHLRDFTGLGRDDVFRHPHVLGFSPESTSVFAISVAKLLFALWKIADAIAREPVVPGLDVVEQTLSEMVLRTTVTATRIFLGVCI